MSKAFERRKQYLRELVLFTVSRSSFKPTECRMGDIVTIHGDEKRTKYIIDTLRHETFVRTFKKLQLICTKYAEDGVKSITFEVFYN